MFLLNRSHTIRMGATWPNALLVLTGGRHPIGQNFEGLEVIKMQNFSERNRFNRKNQTHFAFKKMMAQFLSVHLTDCLFYLFIYLCYND